MSEEQKHSAETGAEVQMPEGIEPNLNELFNRNPLEWGEEDLERVVQHFRASRAVVVQSQENSKKAGTDKRRASAKVRQALKKPVGNIDLGDLGL